jgi:tetratricopeptide (TPR) repeat protein
MAKSKPNDKAKKQARKEAKKMATSNESPEQLYAAALTFIEQQQPAEALQQALKLYEIVQNRSVTEALPALNLLGEISVELGEVDTARGYFEQAVKLDPMGTVGGALADGAEKFLWLAQLAEEGGKHSVAWFEKGAQALQNEIAALESGQATGLDEEALLLLRVEKKRKLANALCGIVEVYMTDLSWEDDAEVRCENLITQAMAAEDETSPEILQTLASVRLSQEKKEDAQAALKRSMGAWKDLDPEDSSVPDFATRISLSRLLMEAELESSAMDVLERLVLEDDESVEAWYLGGWCQYLIAKKTEQGDVGPARAGMTDAELESNLGAIYKGSRRWLKTALKLYKRIEYEDERLKQHAEELVAGLDGILGPEKEGEEDVDDEWEDEWQGIEEEDDAHDDADTEMKDS